MDISQLGTGAKVDTPDQRDFKYSAIAAGAAPVDWSMEFRLPEPPDENQNSSDSCVAQSSSYLHWQHKGKDYSRRDLFSRIFLDYGAMLRDGVKQTTKTGQQTRDECADPKPQTPANMRIKSSLPDSAGMDDLEASYFSVGNTPDEIAQAVRDHRGCIFGVVGNWDTWKDLTNPEPPAPNTVNWQHAIYAFGYHLHDGQRCIIAKSSWCNSSHNEHHIKENYFKLGMTFSPWAVVPKEQFMFTNYKVKVITEKGEAFGVLTDTPNTSIITKAEDEAEWRSYSKQDSYSVHTVNADGSTDWGVDKVIDLRKS
ncbi:MAG: hypothetical protein AB7U82_01105 [Blastocatellales bacterium]